MGGSALTADPMEAGDVGVDLSAQAVEIAGTADKRPFG
jgi:hypothetical protein